MKYEFIFDFVNFKIFINLFILLLFGFFKDGYNDDFYQFFFFVVEEILVI